MFERYTEKARRVIFWAKHEASAFRSPFIETEHLLLGLIREERPLLIRLIGNEETVVRLVTKTEWNLGDRHEPTPGDLPLANASKGILASAAEEADRMNDGHIGPEHLLLGLLSGPKSLLPGLLPREKTVAGEILREARLDQRKVRDEIARIRKDETSRGDLESGAH